MTGIQVIQPGSGAALDADLTAIAALSPSNDDIIQRKAGAWTNRTMAQLSADLGKGTNGIYDVTAYGATGGGVTDDQPAIQDAIDAAGAAGGGVVWVPAGTYLLEGLGYDGSGSDDAHLAVPYSNVTIAGVGDSSVLHATDDNAMFWTGTPTTDFRDSTYYALTGTVAYGASSVTCATAADAGNFAAGDYIAIRTGQTIGTGTGQPDGEFNRVVAADSDTGVITLAWPTAKPYAQEWFVSGTSGVTSTSETANAAVFGVANVSDRIRTGQRYRDLRFIHDSATRSQIFTGRQLIDTIVERCSYSGRLGLWSTGAHRFTTIRDCRLHHPGTAPTYLYTLAADTMSGDIIWDGNQITGEHVVSLHIHEGASRVKVVNNTIACPDGTGANNYISIRARAYDISIIGNIITGATPAAIYVDSTCTGGGVIADNQLLGSSGYGVSVNASGWATTGNRFPNGAAQYGNPTAGVNSEVRLMSAWVSYTNTEVTLGYLPVKSILMRVTTQVKTLFNSDGTDLITVGFDGTTNAFGTSVDVSSTGIKTHTLGGYAGEIGTAHPVKAYYANGGSAATTGLALVTVEYSIAATST